MIWPMFVEAIGIILCFVSGLFLHYWIDYHINPRVFSFRFPHMTWRFFGVQLGSLASVITAIYGWESGWIRYVFIGIFLILTALFFIDTVDHIHGQMNIVLWRITQLNRELGYDDLDIELHMAWG